MGLRIRRHLPRAACAALLPLALGAAGQDGAARRWQGAWVLRDADYPGSVEAWSVAADRVTVYDAARRRSDRERFSVLSPCDVERTWSVGGENREMATDTFVFAGDGLHVARAPAAGGFRRGPLVVACVGDRVYTFDRRTGRCQRHDAAMTGPPLTADAECEIVQGGAGPSFIVRPFGGGSTVRLDFYGDALLSHTLLVHRAERRPSLRSAVERAAALAR